MTDPDEDDEEVELPSGLADMTAEELLDHAIAVVASAKTMLLSASVLVSRDEVVGILRTAKEKLPDEMRQARWMMREKEDFIAEKARDAEKILDDVRAQAERMVQRTEIVRQANQVAQRILDDANEDARRMRHEAEDYCDQKLANMEIVLDRITRTVKSGREKLLATPPPPDIRAPAASAPEVPAPADDGFFDQDKA